MGDPLNSAATVNPNSTLSRRTAITLSAATLASPLFAYQTHAAEFPTTWKIGDVTVTKLVEMTGPFRVADAFAEAKPEMIAECADWLVPHFYDPKTASLLFSYHGYAIRTPHHIIIVDGGFGNDKVRHLSYAPAANMRHGPFLNNLRAAGIRPEQVNFVINTHFHEDHIGWNTRLVGGKWDPTYPKARYLFQKAELASVAPTVPMDEDTRTPILDSIQPILDAKLVDVIDGDHEIDDNARIVFTPGHTPGHHSLLIESQGRRAIFSGDIAHSPLEVRYPELLVSFEKDKEAGRAQRIKFVNTYTDSDATVFAAHFGGPTAGKIVSEKGGKRKFQTLIA